MQLVVAHNNVDFDSLAAQFAVTLLHPSARMAISQPITGKIRSFVTLYRSSLPIVQLKYVDLGSIAHLYLVDNQQIDRLDKSIQDLINKGVSYTIFDHHKPDKDSLLAKASKESVVSEVGAATTLLVEQIMNRRLQINAFESTLLAIGIYDDTGCLSHNSTTARDVNCVSFLLQQGADLSIVNQYIRVDLDDKQLDLFQRLVAKSEVLPISGKRIVLAPSVLSTYLDGLATLTSKLAEVESTDAAFTAVQMKDRIHIVGRSNTPSIDVKKIVQAFGGDGHPGAGSAVVKNTTPEKVLQQIKRLLQENISVETKAVEIMTSPVRTIHADMSMEEAGKLMIRHAVDGLIVTEDQKVIGVISRRDVDQALHHKLGHAPVSGFMSSPVVSVEPDAPLSAIQDLLVKNDIGRLPVIDARGKLLGLVSRNDMLRQMLANKITGDFIPGPFESKLSGAESAFSFNGRLRQENQETKLSTLDAQAKWLFATIGETAQQNNMVAYAIGGSVRDILLGRKNFDFDFVIEGSAIRLARELVRKHPTKCTIIAEHERFQTATIQFHGEADHLVDLSTARIEFYEFPAALPTVEPSILEHDLFRRDFTINALAICINPASYGILIDYFSGLDDLKNKLIRILHPFSFIEDPTRIIRAARFASRLGFSLEKKTEEQAKRAIAIGKFDNLGGIRMKEELKSILESQERLKGLDILGRLGGKLRYLDEQLEFGQPERIAIRRAEQVLKLYELKNTWVVYLALLLSRLDKQRLAGVLQRLHLSNDDRAIVASGMGICLVLKNQTADLKRSQIYEILHGNSNEALAIAASLAKPGSATRRMIKLYFEELRFISVELSGKDLLKLGYTEGPKIGQALKALLDAKLDQLVSSKKSEEEFVKNHKLANEPSALL